MCGCRGGYRGDRTQRGGNVENLRRRTEVMALVLLEAERTMALLRQDLEYRNRRPGAWYRERRDMETNTRFDVLYAARLMFCDL